ncbi:MAG TPA: acyltransferase, partial [Ideonella sp.]|nr:acyltransferase [Ideonella sp.]
MKIDNQGERNQVLVPHEPAGNLDVSIKGNDNVLRIGSGCRFPRAQIEIRGDRCEIDIGDHCVLIGEFRCRDHRTVLRIGAKTTSMGLKITMHESGSITIGDDCMFSGEVRMDTSDMHSVIDLATRQRINPPADIQIGKHVWVGYGVYLMKGARIGAGSVIGACSIVTRAVPPHSAAAGAPAKVIRKGITWDRA